MSKTENQNGKAKRRIRGNSKKVLPESFRDVVDKLYKLKPLTFTMYFYLFLDAFLQLHA
jgi:hypothetical protein